MKYHFYPWMTALLCCIPLLYINCSDDDTPTDLADFEVVSSANLTHPLHLDQYASSQDVNAFLQLSTNESYTIAFDFYRQDLSLKDAILAHPENYRFNVVFDPSIAYEDTDDLLTKSISSDKLGNYTLTVSLEEIDNAGHFQEVSKVNFRLDVVPPSLQLAPKIILDASISFSPFGVNTKGEIVGQTYTRGIITGVYYNMNHELFDIGRDQYITAINEASYMSCFNGSGAISEDKLERYYYDNMRTQHALPPLPASETNQHLFYNLGVTDHNEFLFSPYTSSDSKNSYVVDREMNLIPIHIDEVTIVKAVAINNQSDVLALTESGPYLWNLQTKQYTKIEDEKLKNFYPFDLNNKGDIVGLNTDAQGFMEIVIYNILDHTKQLLDRPIYSSDGYGLNFFYIRSINDDKTVVGYARDVNHGETPLVWNGQGRLLNNNFSIMLKKTGYGNLADSGYIALSENNLVALNVTDAFGKPRLVLVQLYDNK